MSFIISGILMEQLILVRLCNFLMSMRMNLHRTIIL